jgi:hypothetical protein
VAALVSLGPLPAEEEGFWSVAPPGMRCLPTAMIPVKAPLLPQRGRSSAGGPAKGGGVVPSGCTANVVALSAARGAILKA